MPPPGIPDWLYPSVVMQETQTHSFVWVQGCYCPGGGELAFEIRYADVTFTEGEPSSVVVRVSRRTAVRSVSQIQAGFAPLVVGGSFVYIDEPDYQDATPEPFTRLPLTGFTRLANTDPGFDVPQPDDTIQIGDQFFLLEGMDPADAEIHSPLSMLPADAPLPPTEGTDAGLEVLSNHQLLAATREGHIRVASAPRVSPLGGVAVFLQHDGPAAGGVAIDRADLSLPPLHFNHDETRGVRILTNRDIQNLQPSPWVREAADALAQRAARVAAARRASVAADLLAYHGINVEEEQRLMQAEADPGFLRGMEPAPEVTIGTVLVARDNPDTMIGIVTRVDQEFANGQSHTFVNVRVSQDGFGQGSEVRLPLEGLLAQAIPAGNAFPPEARQPNVQIFEVEGGVAEHTQRFLEEQLRRNAGPLITRPAPVVKPARTSFERLLEDDDD